MISGTVFGILCYDPDHIVAKQELAHSLLVVGKYNASRRHFNDLLKTDPDRSLHNKYRRFIALIDQNKPVGLSWNLAMLPAGADFGRPEASHMQYNGHKISGSIAKIWGSGLYTRFILFLLLTGLKAGPPLLTTPDSSPNYPALSPTIARTLLFMIIG